MNMKKKWFRYYYFLIGLPVAFYGVFFWEPKPYVEEYPDIFKSVETQLEVIDSGEYSLYDISEMEKIGRLSIEVHREDEKLIVSGSGRPASGLHGYSESKYSFPKTEFDEIVFKPYIVDGYVVWFCRTEKEAYTFSIVKNEWFVSEKYKNLDGNIFIFEKVPEKEIDYYLGGEIPVQINNSIFVFADEAEYSGLILIHQEDKIE